MENVPSHQQTFLSCSWDSILLVFIGSWWMLSCLGFCWGAGWMKAVILCEWGLHRDFGLLKKTEPSAFFILLINGFQGALVSSKPIKRVLPPVGFQISVARTPGGWGEETWLCVCLQFLQLYVAVASPHPHGGSQPLHFPFSIYSRLLLPSTCLSHPHTYYNIYSENYRYYQMQEFLRVGF